MPVPVKIIAAFIKLGEFLKGLKPISGIDQEVITESREPELSDVIKQSHWANPWFIPEFVTEACDGIGDSLTPEKVQHWLEHYREKLEKISGPKNIGVVMAGNIPLVGFHDFLCVLMSGNRIIGKLSSDDNKLLPMISKKLIEFEPGLENYITLTESKLENIDAVIATGSNNTSRYFGYYFGKYPHIIRKNRNSIAVLGGHETNIDLEKLGKDIFLYFGMGCRSVSKLYIPKGYSFDRLLQSLEKFRFVTDHHKYTNNYEYYKSIFLINGDPHFDNGFLLLKQDRAYASPPAVLFYEEYDDLKLLLQRIRNDFQEIQCIVSNLDQLNDAIPFGSAQKPELWDYADGVDTMEFLLNL